MTYFDLLSKLAELSPAQLNMDCAILLEDQDECFPIGAFQIISKGSSLDRLLDIFDENHPILVVMSEDPSKSE